LVHRREVGAAERKERVNEDEQRILNLRPIAGKFRTPVLALPFLRSRLLLGLDGALHGCSGDV